MSHGLALRSAMIGVAIAGIFAGAIAASADRKTPAGGAGDRDDSWVGAQSVDRFTDASWTIAAGRGVGDKGNRYELRVSCRRNGDRRDLDVELVLFDADGRPLTPAWEIERRTGAEMRSLRWRLDGRPAARTAAYPTQTENAARLPDWSWQSVEMGLRIEERDRRSNTEKRRFLVGLREGDRLLLGDLVEGEAVEFRLPGSGKAGDCPLCETIDDCLAPNGVANARRSE